MVELSSEPGHYTFMEVMEMIDKPANQIGKSESGVLYHGKLPTGQEVAMKVWEQKLHSAAEEFFEFKKVRSLNVQSISHPWYFHVVQIIMNNFKAL